MSDQYTPTTEEVREAGMIVRTFDVHRDYWLNANQRLHWAQRKTRTAYLRHLAWAGSGDRLVFSVPVHVLATISTPTNSRFDPPNAAPTVKALIDGLVDAGVLADDDHEHVPRVSFERGPKTGKPGLYRIRLTLTSAGDSNE